MLHLFLERFTDSPLKNKSNWKGRRAVTTFSVFFVFGQQLNRDQSECATKAQSREKERLSQMSRAFRTVCRGIELGFNTVNEVRAFYTKTKHNNFNQIFNMF